MCTPSIHAQKGRAVDRWQVEVHHVAALSMLSATGRPRGYEPGEVFLDHGSENVVDGLHDGLSHRHKCASSESVVNFSKHDQLSNSGFRHAGT